MKIILKDFGPISHFEFDLEKDMHVIFGKNSVGKSYASTIVYLLLKNVLSTESQNAFNNSHSASIYSDIITNGIVEALNENGRGNEEEFLFFTNEKISEILFYEFKTGFRTSLVNSFQSIKQLTNISSQKTFSIALEFENFTLSISSFEDELLFKPEIEKNATERLHAIGFHTAEGYVSNREISLLRDYILSIINSIHDEIYRHFSAVYYLPASRSGLYQALNTFSSVFAELSKSRTFLKSKIEIPNLPEPVADYFLHLSTINNDVQSELSEAFEYIENKVLNGAILFNSENKKIYFKQNNIPSSFDLTFTSSMVSEIAPIVAFLKYIVPKYMFLAPVIIFIEEPEAHLHPEIQVKLMEIFSLLSDRGVKIVMTSHSNYMFNKLSNLLLEGKVDPNKVSSYLMRMTDKGSVTDMLSMKAEADGMNDENFADVAEMLYEERIKIYDKLNQK